MLKDWWLYKGMDYLKYKKGQNHIGDVRAVGFHIGVEFVKKDKEKLENLIMRGCTRMRDMGFNNGIIFGVGGTGKGKSVLKIKPPLITTKEQGAEILDKFSKNSQRDVYAENV